MKKRVYIAYTGGTIGMKKTAEGYEPVPGYFQHLLEELPELARDPLPNYHLHEYRPLLDSADMSPTDWLKIARDIAAHHDHYDGFVVLHGTDTMAYTASVLHFFLDGLQKPVILTGSQIPLCEIRNDARENLVSSLLIAAHFPLPEVLLCFGGLLLRGNRAVKVNATGFDAFASPNFPPLGRLGVEIEIDWSHVLPAPNGKRLQQPKLDHRPKVAALRLFPGISASLLESILAPPLQGLVLETYGIGNGPSHDRRLLNAIQAACRRGVVIVNCTQCVRGHVDQGSYATGSALARAGVISGYDMTTEAALSKLFFLLSRDDSPQRVRQLMQRNLKGELTVS